MPPMAKKYLLVKAKVGNPKGAPPFEPLSLRAERPLLQVKAPLDPGLKLQCIVSVCWKKESFWLPGFCPLVLAKQKYLEATKDCMLGMSTSLIASCTLRAACRSAPTRSCGPCRARRAARATLCPFSRRPTGPVPAEFGCSVPSTVKRRDSRASAYLAGVLIQELRSSASACKRLLFSQARVEEMIWQRSDPNSAGQLGLDDATQNVPSKDLTSQPSFSEASSLILCGPPKICALADPISLHSTP